MIQRNVWIADLKTATISMMDYRRISSVDSVPAVEKQPREKGSTAGDVHVSGLVSKGGVSIQDLDLTSHSMHGNLPC
jgi:hypothetical protein